MHKRTNNRQQLEEWQLLKEWQWQPCQQHLAGAHRGRIHCGSAGSQSALYHRHAKQQDRGRLQLQNQVWALRQAGGRAAGTQAGATTEHASPTWGHVHCGAQVRVHARQRGAPPVLCKLEVAELDGGLGFPVKECVVKLDVPAARGTPRQEGGRAGNGEGGRARVGASRQASSSATRSTTTACPPSAVPQHRCPPVGHVIVVQMLQAHDQLSEHEARAVLINN